MTRLSFVFILLTLLSLTGCSVYKSEGRKAFESQAPDHVDTGFLPEDSGNTDAPAQTCWHQPVDEALWHVDAHSKITVRKMSDDQIEACLIEE